MAPTTISVSKYKPRYIKPVIKALSKNPEIIMDVSHNKEGFKYVVEQLKNKSFKRLHER